MDTKINGENMRKLLFLFSLLLSSPAFADVDIVVNKRTQTMKVYVDGDQVHSWPVSTARKGYITPSGTYHPYSLQPMHYSRKYDNAPMPHSIFFSGGYAIHATPHTGNLGHAASHGCVRLHPTSAATLYSLVQNNRNNTTITIN